MRRRIPDQPAYLTSADVAAIFKVSPKTVTRWAKEGKLPHRNTLGGHRRYPEKEIRALADTLAVSPKEGTARPERTR